MVWVAALAAMGRVSIVAGQTPASPPPASQNPSPMTEPHHFARAAMRGEKRFIVTHSEIFPGTFASTTETADWLIHTLGLRRTPVVRWGPRGMQQLSEVRSGDFEILGFAGNSGPDHIDQLHSMPEFLARLLKQ